MAILFICIASFSAQAEQFKVVRVADWDTLTILQQGQKVRVRLVGIDAPETSRSKHKSGQPYSQKSKKHLAGLVLNQQVAVKSYGQDRYGRILGEVLLGGANINLEMVTVGLAEVYRGRAPKGMDTQMYWQAEKAAKGAGRNVWSLGSKYVSPKEWRRKEIGSTTNATTNGHDGSLTRLSTDYQIHTDRLFHYNPARYPEIRLVQRDRRRGARQPDHKDVA